jgi:hypothetical protein
VTAGVARTLAVAITDVRARLRRPASAWLLVALALAAYFTVPPASGSYGLFVIDGARARYTSEALAFATATLLPIFLGFFGFYVVSRALGHDAATNVGPLVATTRVGSVEYLGGKLLGSTIVLSAVTAGFLVCILGMHLVRGEGPLLPQVYASHYLVIGGPCIVGVAAFALFFECVPGLRGRAGDVAYFFVWSTTMGLALEPWKGQPSADPGIGRLLDYGGVGFAVAQTIRLTGSPTFSIGYAPHELTKPPIDFPGLAFTPAALAWRAESLLLPLLLVLGAVAFFHRFDPARVRAGVALGRRSPLALVHALARPLTRGLLALVDRLDLASLGPSPLRSVAAELLLTARLNPLFALAPVLATALALVLPPSLLRAAALPALVALLVPLLADLPTREKEAGVSGIVYTTPGLRRRLVPLKLATAAAVALLVTGVPALRLLLVQPGAGVSLLLGSLLLAASCVLLGIVSSSPKPFVALALAFWYVALNAGAAVPALDFAGWSAAATPTVQIGYALIVAFATALALAVGRLQSALAD